ncbi:MAG: hypothetical protein WCE49_09035, partial [Terrimicrobiaceae bacterium]
AAQLVREGGASQVGDATELEEKFRELLLHAEQRAALAANAMRCLDGHYGATERTRRALEKFESSGVAAVG